MTQYPGGCAIMLKVPLGSFAPPCVASAKWTSPPWILVPPDDYHLTLQFVGRDLDGDKIASTIYSAFLFARDPFPTLVEFTGVFGMLTTRKGRYMVAHVKSESLEAPRMKLQEVLGSMGVVPNDPFDFSPHVTMAEATPDAPKAKPPGAIEPFSVPVNQIEVKYGPYRMSVQL